MGPATVPTRSVFGPYRLGIGPYWILLDPKISDLDLFEKIAARPEAYKSNQGFDHWVGGASIQHGDGSPNKKNRFTSWR